MIIFIITRILDVITTYMNIFKWGNTEGNPFMRILIDKHLLIPYQFMITLAIIWLLEIFPKYKNIIYISLSILGILTIIVNIYSYLFI